MLSSGTRLGPYEIQSPIAAGGMGEVYRARDTRLDRIVAVKVLSSTLADSAESRGRFEREAHAVSRLAHPHICALFDVGEAPAETGRPPIHFLVMEFLEGETLAQRLAAGALPLPLALEWGAQIAAALAEAHRHGIVHGDLKPGNIMVTKSGVKLLDFGLARQFLPAPPAAWSDAETRALPAVGAGSAFGTLQYAAPEVLEGAAADPRADIFACGAVIYEMASGRKAFAGESPAAVMAAILRHDPPSLTAVAPGLPPALDRLVAACLAKDRDLRWQNAGDLSRELSWLAAAAPGDAAATPARRGVSWRTVLAAAALLTAVAALAAIAGLSWRDRPDTAPAYRTSIVLPDGLRFPQPSSTGGSGRFALSPDATRAVFVAVDGRGTQQLWVRPLDSLSATPVRGTEGASSPFWSPDSRSVAFIAQGQLKVVDLEGGSPAIIAPALNATGAWSRDDMILFTPNGASAIYRTAPSGGTPQPVTRLDEAAGEVLHRSPFFLPDGRHFLYVTVGQRDDATTGARGVYIGSLDPDEPPKLLIDAGANAAFADGHVVFLRGSALLAQPFDMDRLELTGEARPVAEPVELAGPAFAAFSVSGAGVLAYQPAAGNGSQLAWFDRRGRPLGTVGEPGPYGDLELSPDGRRAVVSVHDAMVGTRDLWIFDVARGVRTRFTSDRADDVAPIWSPDGASLVFASNRRGRYNLYRKAASGLGAEELLYEDGRDKFPASWAGDVDALLYWTFDGADTGMMRLPLAPGARPAPFLGPPVSLGRLSPDGRWFAYASGESGRSEIYVVPFPQASQRWQVSSAGGSLPRWRRDSREIFYAGRDNRLMGVTIAPDGAGLEFEQAQPLFSIQPVAPRSFFDVAADGERFLFNLPGGDTPPSIAIVQHWLAGLQQ